MTKIDIFSGFLGAGKTTLIKKLIADGYAGERLVLIENEFGEIGIDGGFLQDAGIQITEMNSGCICCSLVGDFTEALGKVLEQYHPDRILIEPSGVGKLSDVIQAVQKVHGDVTLNSFTTVVDAKKAKMYMKNFGEFFNNQIEHASTIVLSHTDGMDEAKLQAAVALLREHNSAAPIVTTPWGQLSGSQLLEAMERQDTLQAELIRLAMEVQEEEHDHDHKHHHHDHDHEHKHKSMSMSTSTSTITMIMIITIIMPTTSSPAGAPRRRRPSPPKRFVTRWRHSPTRPPMATCSAPRASSLRRTAVGFISTTSPASRTSARVPLPSPAVCASSAPI